MGYSTEPILSLGALQHTLLHESQLFRNPATHLRVCPLHLEMHQLRAGMLALYGMS